MKKSLIDCLFLFCMYATSLAKIIFPSSETATNSIELGVEGIDRICPAGLWDSWIFREIIYDRESNTVLWVIQSSSPLKGFDKISSEQDVKKITKWIVTNVIEGYNDLIENPKIFGDGDFMLYLGLGTLLKEMEENKTTLQIALLYPDWMSMPIKDIPLTLDYTEIKHLYDHPEKSPM